MIKPLADRVIVESLSQQREEEETATGIIIPGTKEKISRHLEGTVIAVGPGRLLSDASASSSKHMYAPMSVKVGDEIVFSFGEEYTIRNKKMYILKETDIIAIITKDK